MCKDLSSDYARHLASWHQRTDTSLYEAFGWTAALFCYPRLGICVPSSRVFSWKFLCTVQLCTGLNRKRDTQNSHPPKKTHKVRDSYYWKRQKRLHKVWVMAQDWGNALTMTCCSSHSWEVVTTKRPYTFFKGPRRMWEVGEDVWWASTFAAYAWRTGDEAQNAHKTKHGYTCL